jgi:hypothetical protein
MNGGSEPVLGASAQDLAEFYDNIDMTSRTPGEPVVLDTSREPMISRSIRFDRATVDRLRVVAQNHSGW